MTAEAMARPRHLRNERRNCGTTRFGFAASSPAFILGCDVVYRPKRSAGHESPRLEQQRDAAGLVRLIPRASMKKAGQIVMERTSSGHGNVRADEVFVLSNGLGDCAPSHAIQTYGVGQTEAALAGLTATRCRRVVCALIHPVDFAAGEKIIEESFNGFPTQTALHQSPRLMQDVIRADQFPAFLFGALKGSPCLRMKRTEPSRQA